MRTLIPAFGSARMLRDYTTRLYRPAAQHGRRMGERNSRSAVEFKRWKKLLESQGDGVRGAPLEVRVMLNGLHAEDLRVEAGGPEDEPVELRLLGQHAEHADFGGVTLPADATQLRVLPAHALMAHRYELGCIATCNLE